MTDTTDHPSRRAGLRDELRRAVCEAEGFVWDSDMLEPDEYGDHADTVLAVLYRAWPWLRAEAEDAASVVVPAADRAALKDRAAADALVAEARRAVHESLVVLPAPEADRVRALLADLETAVEGRTAMRSAVLPAPASTAAALEEAADAGEDVANRIHASGDDHRAGGAYDVVDKLRELAAAVPAVGVAADTTPADTQDEEIALLRLTLNAVEEGRRELRSDLARIRARMWTLTAMLDELHTLLATSSRDWQTYRVDAWLWAVLVGWDCEQPVHDETCTHGAMEETAAMHGWDAATVAKARRYRALVHVLTGPVVPAQPGTDTKTPSS
jgi:hypothetical protein